MWSAEGRARLGRAALMVALGLAGRAAAQGLEIEGGVTGVALYPDDARIKEDRTLSADLNLLWTTRDGGRWLAYIEGNSSLNEARASTRLPEINADAGTALDPDRNGRVQLSELNYRFERPDGARITLGYLDPSSYLDRSRITNDENVQFLGASFVNNPSIEFPDYTLGAVYERPASGRMPQLNAVLASSNGLADNPNLSYSQLIQLSESEKGAFAALGLGWPGETRLVRVGAWLNTRNHSSLDGSSHGQRNYGLYAVLGQSFGDHALNLRLGLAKDEVTQAARFTALAYRLRLGAHAIGFGLAHAALSSHALEPGLDDTLQAELFGRLSFGESMHLTLSLQHVEHSSFVAAPADPRDSVRVAGLRFHYGF